MFELDKDARHFADDPEYQALYPKETRAETRRRLEEALARCKAIPRSERTGIDPEVGQ